MSKKKNGKHTVERLMLATTITNLLLAIIELISKIFD